MVSDQNGIRQSKSFGSAMATTSYIKSSQNAFPSTSLVPRPLSAPLTYNYPGIDEQSSGETEERKAKALVPKKLTVTVGSSLESHFPSS